MRVSLVLVGLATLTGVAHAQAPGQVAPVADSTVMTRPWSVALSLVAESITPRTDNASSVGIGAFELGAHYRLRPEIELGLALGGGSGDSGTIATGALWVDFRYHFLWNRPWNILALGSLGVMSAGGQHDPSDNRRGRGALRLGAGVERRIGNWGLEADLRWLGVGDNTRAVFQSDQLAYEVAYYGLSGVSFTLGGRYYF